MRRRAIGPVVAVHAPERDGEAAGNAPDGPRRPFSSVAFERAGLGPASGGIGEDQGEGASVGNAAAAVGCGGDFTKPGLFTAPPPERPYRNLPFEGERASRPPLPPLPALRPFGRGTAGFRPLRPRLRRRRELDGHGFQALPERGCQPLAADPVEKSPDSRDVPSPAPPGSTGGLRGVFPAWRSAPIARLRLAGCLAKNAYGAALSRPSRLPIPRGGYIVNVFFEP